MILMATLTIITMVGAITTMGTAAVTTMILPAAILHVVIATVKAVAIRAYMVVDIDL